jgi:hypothetical protein
MARTVGEITKQGLAELPMTLADELAGLLRGSAKVTLGMPGDANEIARDYIAPLMPYRFRQILEGLQNVPALPTSEELDKKFAPVLPEGADPRRKISAKIGEGVGEWTPFNPVAATRMTGRAAGRGLKAVDKAISTSPTSGGKKSQRGVIKAPGGNWLQNHALEESLKILREANQNFSRPEQQLKKMREAYPSEALAELPLEIRNDVANSFNLLNQDVALNKWIDANLGNYIKKQMGTADDPIRALAESGITHVNLGGRYGGNAGAATQVRRAKAGFPEEGMGISPAAREWEHASDVAIRNRPVSTYFADNRPENLTAVENNSWMSKVPQDTTVHHLSYGGLDELGFPQLVTHLKGELTAGRIRPEQLNKVSMPDAVQSVFAKNEAARKAKEAAEAAAVRANLSLNPYKEYPSGHKWIELPDPNESEQAMKTVQDIGCQGGWCTQQEYNAKDYGDKKMGNSLYALIDPSGKPHVQVHTVTNPQDLQRAISDITPAQEEQIKNAIQQKHNIELDDYDYSNKDN